MDKRKKGFITTILLAIIALALLKYFFNWSIFDAAASPQGSSTIKYIRDVINTVWSYIAAPVMFTWDQILEPLIVVVWKNFQAFIQWGHTTASFNGTPPQL